MAVVRGNRVGGNLQMKWDEVKKIPLYSHRLTHRKRVTSKLHDSYFRSMTIAQAIPKIAEVTHPKAKEPSLSYYLPIAGGRIIGFIPFPRVLVLCEMQSFSSRIRTRVAVSISYDDNHYTMGTSKTIYKSGVLSILLHSSKTWILFRMHLKLLEDFHQNGFRCTLYKWNTKTQGQDSQALSLSSW